MGDGRAFGQLLVVVMGDGGAGAYTAKLFGDLGAEVVRVGLGPTMPGASFFDSSVREVISEIEGDPVVMAADVVIQSSAVDPLDVGFVPRHDRQILLRISPFATTGPYAQWRSTDLVDTAIGGHLRLSGDPEREPLASVHDLVHLAAGTAAFIGTVAALVARTRTGRGQTVETSHQEVIAALHQFTLCRYTHAGALLNRQGNRYAGPGSTIGAYECRDGWIGLALSQQDQMERMLEVTGLIAMLDRDDVDSVWDLMTDPGLLDSELIPYLLAQPRDDIVELFQALRLPCAPVSTVHDLLADDHLIERDFWSESDVDGVLHPGPPFRMSGHLWAPGPKDRTRRMGGVPPVPVEPAEPIDLSDGPLAGFRVLDMTRVWAGPLAARLLADLGAEVVMAEVPWTRTPQQVEQVYVDTTHFFPDDDAGDEPWNRSAFHNKYANNKLSAVIELDKAEGRDVYARLVPHVDVVIENYAPRVMPGFGFDETTLHQLNPELIYVTMPGYGRSGPHTDWVAYGPTIDGHVGHTSLTGYLGEGPWKCGIAWPDPIAGLHAAAATVVALLDRLVEPEGGGQTVEVAQIEAAINVIGTHVVAAQEEGPGQRWGNRRPGRAPQGVYPCVGDDRWIAISVVDQRAWAGLCAFAGWDELADLNVEQRWELHDELDTRLAELTGRCDDQQLMHELQAAGVPAGAVLGAPEIMADPQLRSIAFFAELDHPAAGAHEWPRFPVRLSLTPATMRRPAATMGEHNEYVLRTLAGLDAEEYEDLLDRGIVRTTPPY